MHLKHGCILESKDEGQIYSSARKIYDKKAPFVPSPTWKTPPTFGGAIQTAAVFSFCRRSSTSLPSAGVLQLTGKSAIRNSNLRENSIASPSFPICRQRNQQQRREPVPNNLRLQISGFFPGGAPLIFTNPTKFNLRTSQTETSKRFVQKAFL